MMEGALATILSNESIRKELISHALQMLIPVLVERGYIDSADVVNPGNIARDLAALLKAGHDR